MSNDYPYKYGYGFLFSIDIENKEWTNYFDNKSNRGISNVAEYFFSKIGVELKHIYPGNNDFTASPVFTARCLSLSKTFINTQCNEQFPNYETDMLCHGESCMVYMPGYYYQSAENESFEDVVNKMFDQILLPSYLLDRNNAISYIETWLKKIFLLRYGIELNSGFRNAAEYWLPCAMLLNSKSLSNSFFNELEAKYIEINLWKYFCFKENRQISSGDIEEPDNTVEYFVVHNTDVIMTARSILKLKGLYDYNTVWHGHAYILESGEIITIVPYLRRARATKTERKKDAEGGKYEKYSHYKKAWGTCIHVELNYERKNVVPTDQQYESLARLYYYFYKANNRKLKIVPHREFDRGIPDGHSDPWNFNFDRFYSILLNKYGVKIVSGIDGIHQHRYEYSNDEDMISHFPPILNDILPERETE